LNKNTRVHLLFALLFGLMQPQCLASDWKHTRPADHVELLKTDRSTRDDAEFHAFEKKVTDTFLAGDVERLQSIASSAWKSGAAMPNGQPKLRAFYYGINTSDRDLKSTDKTAWEHVFAIADRWQKAHPDSPFAGLAKTTLLIDYAWSIRGKGYSDTVSAEASEGFESTIREVKRRLEESKPVTGAVPEWYAQMADVYRYLSLDPNDLQSLTDEALQKFPGYYEIYTNAAKAFLPKWGGSDADFAKFAKHVEEAAPPGYGPMLYARIYYSASCCDYYDGAVFTKGGADWPMLKQGLEAMRQRYPDAFNVDMEAYFSCSAMDVGILPKLMGKIGNSPHPAIWKDSYLFRNCQDMAERMKHHPDGPRSEWYPPS